MLLLPTGTVTCLWTIAHWP